MKSVLVFLSVVSMIGILSCTKKEDVLQPDKADNPNINEGDSYTQLKTGNYWVFEYQRIDSNGMVADVVGVDTVSILGDTMINGKQYFIRSLPMIFASLYLPSYDTFTHQVTTYLRDSSQYMVDHTGEILFSPDDFSSTFSIDTIENIIVETTHMTGMDSTIILPAGRFVTRSFELVYDAIFSSDPWSTRRAHYAYAPGVGLVNFTYCFFSQHQHFNARLVSYHLEE